MTRFPRRLFLALCCLSGCRPAEQTPVVVTRVPSKPERAAVVWQRMIESEVEAQFEQAVSADEDVVSFDPTLMGLLIQFVWPILQRCLDQQIRRKQAAVRLAPAGRVASRMRATLAHQFREKHPDANEEAVDQHVERMVTSFGELTTSELDELLDAAKNDDAPDNVDWAKADTLTRELNRE